ncbi:hypothetical protein B0H11DRAFT_2171235, partial [Mycena galericulata]
MAKDSPGTGSHQSTFSPATGAGDGVLTPQSKMRCPLCNKDITVGTGGEKNLERHKGSGPCKKNQEEMKAKNQNAKQRTLDGKGGFFKRVVRAISPKLPDPQPVHPWNVPMEDPPSEPEHNSPSPGPSKGGFLGNVARAVSPTFFERNSSPGPSTGSSLRNFSTASSPRRSVSPRSTSPSLHRSSFQSDRGSSAADLSVNEFQSGPDNTYSVRVDGDTDIPASRQCPGIQIDFPPGQNPHLSYPFGVHAAYQLPWGYRFEGDRFYL